MKYIRDRKDKHQISIDEGHLQLSNESNQRIDTKHQSLYNAIGKLGEVDRLIMIMILDELEYEEISNVIGISEVNLRVKIHRIKKKLKNILENE